MTPELEATLVKRYPEIFKEAGGDPAQTCMAFGLEVGDGWYDLIDTLCSQLVGRLRQEQRKLDYLVENEGKDVYGGVVDRNKINEQILKVEKEMERVPVAAQVKEKFGGLRFYTNNSTPEQDSVISLAEAMSERICEHCGDKGMQYPIGWVRTLCSEHADKAHGEKAARHREKIASKQSESL